MSVRQWVFLQVNHILGFVEVLWCPFDNLNTVEVSGNLWSIVEESKVPSCPALRSASTVIIMARFIGGWT